MRVGDDLEKKATTQ
jgi:hypothetical protein